MPIVYFVFLTEQFWRNVMKAGSPQKIAELHHKFETENEPIIWINKPLPLPDTDTLL